MQIMWLIEEGIPTLNAKDMSYKRKDLHIEKQRTHTVAFEFHGHGQLPYVVFFIRASICSLSYAYWRVYVSCFYIP